jgi:hypothetical protein
MRQGLCLKAAVFLLAAAAALSVLATSSVAARHRSHHAARHRSSDTEKKSVTPTARTPVDKDDCVNVSQAFYGHARTVFRRTKQGVPREFERVVSNLDEFCGEEDFEKARVTIDWMSSCLQNFTKDNKDVCSRNKSYFCAIDPQSKGCLAEQ